VVGQGWPLAGLERPGVHEFLGERGADRAAALSLLLCGAASLSGAAEGRLVWVQTRGASRRWGLPCGEDLESIGLDPRSALFVEPENERELLWVLEQALDCSGALAVVGCLPGVERHYGFTASRRLSLRALRNGSRLFLTRGARIREATSAQTRWRVEPASSTPSGLAWRGFELPGARSWRVNLLRAPGRTPAAWNIEWSEHENRLRMAASPAEPDAVRATG
jgi:protein ImuA